MKQTSRQRDPDPERRLSLSVSSAAEKAVVIPPPAVDNPKAAGPMQTAVLAGGCFWGVQGVFEHLQGREARALRLLGRRAAHRRLRNGERRRHRARRVRGDHLRSAAGDLRRRSCRCSSRWRTIPRSSTARARTSGTQYRSAIFYADETQKKIAEAYIAQLEQAKVYRAPIVTRVDPLKGFYAAEDYHQDFLLKNPDQPYIVYNDLPKIRNFQGTLPALYRGKPVTVASKNP